jgi:hypothetical protein
MYGGVLPQPQAVGVYHRDPIDVHFATATTTTTTTTIEDKRKKKHYKT